MAFFEHKYMNHTMFNAGLVDECKFEILLEAFHVLSCAYVLMLQIHSDVLVCSASAASRGSDSSSLCDDHRQGSIFPRRS